jgi:hypothetical protein
MPTFSVSNTAGVTLTNVDATSQFTTGTVVNTSDGGQAVYVQALSEISTYAAVAVYDTQKAQMMTTTLAATCKRIGFAQTSIASGYYGWVQLGGKVVVNLGTNAGSNVPLYTTSTPGVLNSTVVSGGAVFGLVATTSISNATAVTCIAGYPHIASGIAGT